MTPRERAKKLVFEAAVPRRVSALDVEFEARPLSPIQTATLARAAVSDADFESRVIAASLGPGIADELDASARRELADAWWRVHAEAHGLDLDEEVVDAVGRELQRMARENDLDQFRAANATQIRDFYGLGSALEASSWQVIYVAHLLAEHDRRVADASRRRAR